MVVFLTENQRQYFINYLVMQIQSFTIKLKNLNKTYSQNST